MRAAAFLLLGLLAACTAEIRESDLLRPIKGGTLTAEAAAEAAPAYEVTQHSMPSPPTAPSSPAPCPSR
jgi:hypothetical protein